MNQPSSLYVARALAIAVGVFMAVMGGLAGIAFLMQLLFSPDVTGVDSAVVSAASVALGMGLGGALAWQGFSALGGRASRLFRPPSLWPLLLFYILVISIGQLIITFDLFPTLTFPLFHVLAASLPVLAILAFVARTLTNLTLQQREVILQLSGGAFVSTFLAFLAEIILGGLILFIAFLLTALTPGGLQLIQEFSLNLQDPRWAEDPANIQQILLMPPVFISLGLVFVVLAPLVEEAAKLLSVTLLGYRQPSRGQIFVWGLAAGAGFALVENLFNTVLALELWGLIMLLRVGGTAMHCLGTGLMALGWHQWRATHRPWKLLGAYGISVTIHALWNGAVIGMAGSSVFALGETSETVITIVGGVVLLMLGLLAVLTVGIIGAIVMVSLRLKNGEPQPTSQ